MVERDLEKELVEGFKKLPPDSQNFILSTVITAVTAQEAARRQFEKKIIDAVGVGDASYIMPGSGGIMEAVNG